MEIFNTPESLTMYFRRDTGLVQRDGETRKGREEGRKEGGRVGVHRLLDRRVTCTTSPSDGATSCEGKQLPKEQVRYQSFGLHRFMLIYLNKDLHITIKY